jgi:uncharacterized protein YlxW (UPF0749 family)
MASKTRVALLVLFGFVLGAVLTLMIPAQAHCGRRTAWRHCWGHVTAIESRASSLQSQVTSLQSRVTSLQSQVTSLQSVSSRISALEAKTGRLNSAGTYTGTVGGSQVTGTIDATQVETPISCSGNPAAWRSFGDGLTC